MAMPEWVMVTPHFGMAGRGDTQGDHRASVAVR
jgi:hypothetical protein